MQEEASAVKPRLTPVGLKGGGDSQQKATAGPKLKPIGSLPIPGLQEKASTEPKLRPIGRRVKPGLDEEATTGPKLKPIGRVPLPGFREEATTEPKLKPIGRRVKPTSEEEASTGPKLKPIGRRDAEDGQKEAARPSEVPPIGQDQRPDGQEEAARPSVVPPIGQDLRPDGQEEASRRREFPPVSLLEVPVDYELRHEVVLNSSERLDIPATEQLQSRFPSPVAPAVPFAVRATKAEGEEVGLNGLVYRRFLLTDVNFDLDQSSLSTVGKETLAEIAEELRNDSKWFFLRFDGHTDNIGSESYNERLSRRRAAAAASYFVTNSGFDPARLFVRGFGESEAIADNETPEGRALNRRVEIIVLEPKGDE
ncbi:MAG: hypothetical protein C0616_09085 [Desulfuromonas sp.]|nr:MAG: hypothetical protein C0616_09085 [Desulfuromonas sp.]